MDRRTIPWKPVCIGMILLQNVLYALLIPLSKRAYQVVPVYTFLMLRYLLATLALLAAGALVFGGQALHRVSPATLSCVQAGMAVVLCAVIGGLTGALGRTDWPAFLRPSAGLAVLYAALVCTVAGYLLQNTALEHTSARLVGVLQCTYPVLAALTAYLFLGERLSPAGLAGAAVILVCAVWESLQKESH